MDKIYTKWLLNIKSISEKDFTIDGVFSTDMQDRHGDIVEQNWELQNFLKNPVILNSHNHFDALEVIGKAEKISVVDGELQGKIKFAVDQNPKAKIIFDMIKGGFLNTFSVGFIPKEFDKDGKITLSELLEISVVSIPANADALVRAKAAGVKDLDKLYERSNNNKQIEKVEEPTTPPAGDSGQGDGGTDKPAGGADAELPDSESDSESKLVEETDTEIKIRLKDPELFDPESFRTIPLKEDKPRVFGVIGKIIGEENTTLQSLRFPKDDGWNVESAQEWVDANPDLTEEEMPNPDPDEPLPEMDPEADQIKDTKIKEGRVLSTKNRNIIESAVEALKEVLTLSEVEKITDPVVKTEVILKTISNAIKQLGELKKVETRTPQSVRAEHLRTVNKMVRELLKVK